MNKKEATNASSIIAGIFMIIAALVLWIIDIFNTTTLGIALVVSFLIQWFAFRIFHTETD
ncbi:hypothetical protein [Salisediminibacterium halotolerans]|uniref:Uncharacterized protein n=1 Tax=Salisediminibacterium halotolerans TaxID=517425 RepID=A0A1H9WBA7_9BACI|nr:MULTISPECIES: hypothetical protein [Salisediminibacterium]RLJ74410.1 hypothetical protein BCL39_1700 [Actinophytocola xinjiangensis]RPE87497.1 hypothetical protein EDD67_1231 [Salisediminibacterium halotolerans]TWG35247.1 hypothetical protein BCL52_1697 [Salisediminibacterium halotolerans]SES31115.1 hypothetical protein SAMN05444126_13122 [Salisediminibacterium haloalkalitolerans]GEL06727.1 hypothetical protein SHA02_01430 [Salisediminibacterium halotolerans]